MDISKSDAVAHLAKWFNAGTEVRAVYSTVTGTVSIMGAIAELSLEAIKFSGPGCELNLYFRATSAFDFKDVRQSDTEGNKARVNKYPTVITVRFNNGDRLEILESHDN